MKKIILISGLLGLSLAASAFAALKRQTVEYKQGDTVLEGYVAYDDGTREMRPGILVVHEWKGLGDYVKMRADMLAKLGYVAFAADIYGKGVRAKDHEEAAKLAGIYKADRKLMRERALAGLDELKKQKYVDPKKTAAIGYCFGGTTVLELARSGADIRGVASFHGGLDTPNPEDAKNIKAKVLVLHGGDDDYTNPQVPAFLDEMRKSGADWQMITYSGAVHSFTLPDAGNDKSKGMAYNETADRRSWKALMDFFDEIFK